MNVRTLAAVLAGCHPEARVLLCAKAQSGEAAYASGDVIEIAVTAVGGTDRLVALLNCVETADGTPVFDAEPHFKRVAVPDLDPAAMGEALREGFASSTEPLADVLERRQVVQQFRQLLAQVAAPTTEES